MTIVRVGLVGFGTIARDEHVPAIARTEGAELVAVASRNATCEGVANYPDLDAMLTAEPGINAVVLCQPPQVRCAAARDALNAGRHVFLEKPPGATVSEVERLVELSRARHLTLFAGWHSRWSPHVAGFKAWCAARTIRRLTITWKEDVRRWHPGQAWIWEAGGFGVFDPGINALSILTAVLPDRIRLIAARLEIPSNRATPIGVEMALETGSGAPISVEFDWRQAGLQTWEIVAEADDGSHRFVQGDTAGTGVAESALAPEYRAMYEHFVDLVRSGASDVDLTPLQLVADAFARGRVVAVDPFLE